MFYLKKKNTKKQLLNYTTGYCKNGLSKIHIVVHELSIYKSQPVDESEENQQFWKGFQRKGIPVEKEPRVLSQ